MEAQNKRMGYLTRVDVLPVEEQELCLQGDIYSARSCNPGWLGDTRSIRAVVGSMVCVRVDRVGLSRELLEGRSPVVEVGWTVEADGQRTGV